MSYTVREEGLGKHTEKKSVFTGRLARCTTEEEARAFIGAIRKKERGARHHVFAYIIGENNPIVRCSDDGEPQGTGGLPVLNVLSQHELTDVCLVVSRFFGGILLGAPGLTRAYAKAASEAAASVMRWQTVRAAAFEVTLSYEAHARLTSFLEHVQIAQIQYGEAVILSVMALLEKADALQASLLDLSQGQAEFSDIREVSCFVREDGLLEQMTDQAIK